MKTEKIVWGLILVFVGGILLLENFGVIDFHWRAVWHLWPLILIVIGANMVINKSDTAWGAASGILITVAVLGFVAYQGINGHARSPRWFNYDYNYNNNDEGDDSDEDNTSDGRWQTNSFSEPYLSTAKRARLEITGGPTSYIISDSSENLIDVNTKQRNARYTLIKTSHDSTDVLKFSMSSGKNRFSFDDPDEAIFKLNNRPVWDINLTVGAGESDLDLSSFKVEKIRLKGGAASFKVKLGMPQTRTDVVTETGMAEVKILVPKDAACLIKTNSGISSKDFDGFDKLPDGTYTTPNYNSATKAIYITLKGGLSDFEVSRY